MHRAEFELMTDMVDVDYIDMDQINAETIKAYMEQGETGNFVYAPVYEDIPLEIVPEPFAQI